LLTSKSCRTFATISSVQPAQPETWEGRVFLTFDIDWAHDEVIASAIDLVEEYGVAATWFITHPTHQLERLRANPQFELGLHPNFLPLLMKGDPSNGRSAEEVLDRLLKLVPEARAVRSHSLVQSGRLLELFSNKGLTHEANTFLPAQSGIALRPWVDWFGVIRVPYFWEDDHHCEIRPQCCVDEMEARPGLRGYSFHPIHLYLNTEALGRYESARDSFGDPNRLMTHRNEEGGGVRQILESLLGLSRRHG
jgi:hypothetical protein